MSDLVDRLRDGPGDWQQEAADEIERLRDWQKMAQEEIHIWMRKEAKLRGLLQWWLDAGPDADWDEHEKHVREALGDE